MKRVVLHVTESHGWSGGTVQALALAQDLRRRGWGQVFAVPAAGEFARACADAGFEVVDLPIFQDYDLRSAWRVAGLARERGAAIVHAHHSQAHAVCLVARLFAPFRLVVNRRVSFRPKRNPFSRWKYASKRIDAYLAVASSIRDLLVEAGVEPARIHLVPSGVDLDRFAPGEPDPEVRRAAGWVAGLPLIGKLANAAPWKGQTVFLEAAKILRERGVRARFVLAGRDTDKPEWRALAEKLGIAADVAFLGYWTKVPELLRGLDISVNAAVGGEGLSGALRESLALAVPVIASDVAGNRELVAHEETGLLFPPGDAAALAGAVERLLKDPDLARRTARTGRARVEAGFSRGAMADRVEKVYLNLLQ